MDPALLRHVEAVAADAESLDQVDPVDEATRLALRHQDPDSLHLWTSEAGFALLIDDELTLVVSPAHRGRGAGGALMQQALAVVAPESPLRAWSHSDHPAAAVLAPRAGMRRARELLVLATEPRRGAPTPPPGVRIRNWQPQDADELLRVNAAAFADHPEQGGMDATDLARRMAEPWFDPADLLVAVGPSGLVGFHWTKRHASGAGEVYVIGVDPTAQGSGLGRVLLEAGLDHLAASGVERVHLYVEGDNTAALALYQRLGFTPVRTHVQYRR
ncbi:mycothiol synthase [Nocardioides limicola]|uniref:mycothiol synthase n=1 Tax=Nocardioides limicola TaxID=2803368 RepID=UPI0027DC203F|nr:mycothiol synthase [Nocardioides sp. DJM-14]